jgi:elongation factor 1-gamma
MHDAFMVLLGLIAYDKEGVDKNLKLLATLDVILEKHLNKKTYLVGAKITLADLYSVSILIYGFKLLFGKEWGLEHPATTRWFDKIINNEILPNNMATSSISTTRSNILRLQLKHN